MSLETYVDPAGAGAKMKVRSKERMPSQGTNEQKIGQKVFKSKDD